MEAAVEVADASDAAELADEVAARFRTMQRHEEAAFVSRREYDSNVADLRLLLEALTAYVVMPRIGVNAF